MKELAEKKKKREKPVPLIRRPLILRIFKGFAVTIGFLFLSTMVFLVWAFKTGRAANSARQEILTELHDRCDVRAEFAEIALDPIEREITLKELEMSHLDGRRILAVEEAIVSVQLLPLFISRLQLERVALLAPEATIELREGQILNLPKCVEPPDPSDEDEAPVAPIVLGISELTVERGRFNLLIDDRFESRLKDIGITLAPGEAGGVNVAIGVDDGMIAASDKKLPLHRFRLLAHLEGLLTRPRALVVDQLDVELAQVEVKGSGSIDLLGPVYEAKLSIAAPIAAVHDFVAGAPPLKGHLDLDISVAGTRAAPRGAGKVVIKEGSVDGYGLGDRTTVSFVVDKSGADLSAFEIELEEGLVNGTGRIDFNEKLAFRAETTATELSLARILHILDVPGSWVNLFATGKATLAGTLNPLLLTGPFDYQVRDFIVYDRAWDLPEVKDKPRDVVDPKYVMLGPKPLRVAGLWTYDEEGITFADAVVETGTSQAIADVRVNFEEKAGLKVVTQLTNLDFADLGPLSGVEFGGQGVVSAVLGGPYYDIRATGHADLDDVVVSGIPFGRATTNIDWTGLTILELGSIQGLLDKTPYSASVRVELENDIPLTISGEIRDGRVQDVLIPFEVVASEWGDPSGKMSSKFDLQGPYDGLTGPVSVTLQEAQILGEQVKHGTVLGRMQQGKVVVDQFELHKGRGRISGAGEIDPWRGDVFARIQTRNMTLQDIDLLRVSQERLDGKFDAQLILGGSLQGVTGTVAATFTDVAAGPLALPGGRLDGRLEGATMLVKGSVLGTALGVEGELHLVKRLPYAATLTMREVAVPRILGGLQGHLDYTGKVNAKAELSGSLVDWHLSDGRIALERAELETPSIRLETLGPARFKMKRGVLETSHIAFSGPRTKLTGQGKIGSKVLDMKVTGRVDLGIVELLSPSIERAGGSLILDSAVGGSPQNMNLVGAGRIEGGVLQWRGFERLTGVTADLSFSQSSVLIDRSQGMWAGGRIATTGSVLLESFRPKNISLSINVDKVRPRMSYPKFDMTGLIAGNLQVEGTPQRIKVRGDLDVLKSRIKPKLDLNTLVGSKLVDVYDPSQEILEFDIALHTQEPLRIKNDRMDVELAGNVRFTGTNERWGMLGAATLLKGGRAFFGREYEVEAGTIEMRERYRFDPRFDLLLNATACSSRIRINMVGTLATEPTFAFTSNPDMDQEDIRYCLVFGVRRTLEADPTTFAADALLKVAGVDREMKKVLPIDQIGLSTEYSSQARGTVPRVNVAKEILDGKVRLEYSSSLVDTTDQRAAVRWRLSRKLTLQGGWTSSQDVPYGDFGVDLKQRWEW